MPCALRCQREPPACVSTHLALIVTTHAWLCLCACLRVLQAMSIDAASVTLKRRIGGGHFGDLWEAVWEGIPVAVKVAHGTSRDVVDALLREVEVAKTIKAHPNVVTVYGVVHAADDELRLLLEYCEDGSLLDWLRARDSVSVAPWC